MPARSTLTLKIEGEQDPPAPYLDQVRHVAKNVNLSVLPGILDNQMNKLYVETGTVAGGGSTDVDLQADLDRYGNALTLADVALVYIASDATSVGTLSVSAAAANGFTNLLATTAALTLSPGDFMLVGALTAGNLAVSGANKALTLAASGGNVDYTVHVWGRA
jgi:hypothetical protein